MTRPRSALGLLCLFNLVFLIVGMPMPSFRQKDKSVAYPCMDHACGCMDAEQCWRGCCCYTREEKLAWARDNGVTPPPFVLAHAEDEQQDCCSHSHSSHDSTSCCQAEKKAKTCCEHHEQATVVDEVTIKWLVTMQAMKCQGQDGWSLLTSIMVIDVSDVAVNYEAASPPEYMSYEDETPISMIADLALPPPRG